MPWMHQGRIVLRIPTDLRQVHAVAVYLSEFAVVTGRCKPDQEVQVATGLGEALNNAMVHGNLEISSELRDQEREDEYLALIRERSRTLPFHRRVVEATVEVGENGVTWTVTDEGPGFRVDALPNPTDPENLTRFSGRGILLMRAFFDEVRFNEKGNQVSMRLQGSGKAGKEDAR